MIQGNVLRVGGLELEISPESLCRTIDVVKALDPASLARLGNAYAVRVGAGHPSSALRTMVMSHVQLEWWQSAKGRVPDMVQKNHEKRQEAISKEVTKGNGGEGATAAEPKKREPKVPQIFKLRSDLTDAQRADLAKIRGQRQITLDFLTKIPDGATNVQLAEQIQAAGVAYPSKAPVKDSVLYHLKGLQTLGFVEAYDQPGV